MDRPGVNSLHLSLPSLKRASTIATPSTRADKIREARPTAIQVKVQVN